MGKIYARLIYNYQTEGIDTKYKTLSDVPEKWHTATKQAYKELYGIDVPE